MQALKFHNSLVLSTSVQTEICATDFGHFTSILDNLGQEQLREGQVELARRCVSEPPSGWSSENFLVPIVAEQQVLIDIIEEDWLLGKAAGKSGWVHTSVFFSL